MTQKTINKRTTTIATVLAAITIALSLAATSQAHDVLATVREKYNCQKRDYHKAYVAELKGIKAAYRDSLAHAAASTRAAVRLCEPSRSLALAQIRAGKQEALACYRRDLLLAKKDYRLALAELEAWYATACRPHSHGHHHDQYVLKTVVPVMPQYVVRKTTTYTVPTTVTTTVPTVGPHLPVGAEFYPNVPSGATHTSGHASEWELISPDAGGPVLGSPTLETYEGPTFDGPVLEAPTHPTRPIGPVIEGPVFPQSQPTTTIEVLPTSSPRPTSLPTHRPAYTTKAMKVTTVTTRPAVQTVVVTKPAVRAVHVVPVSVGYGPTGHGHGHRGHGHAHHPSVVKQSRSAAVGNLVVHALRALGR